MRFKIVCLLNFHIFPISTRQLCLVFLYTCENLLTKGKPVLARIPPHLLLSPPAWSFPLLPSHLASWKSFQHCCLGGTGELIYMFDGFSKECTWAEGRSKHWVRSRHIAPASPTAPKRSLHFLPLSSQLPQSHFPFFLAANPIPLDQPPSLQFLFINTLWSHEQSTEGFFCVGNISFPSSHHHRSLHFCIQAINQHTISECWDRWWVKSSIDIILWMWKRKIRCVRHRAGWRLTIDFFHFVYFIEITFGNFRFPVSVD